MSLWLPSALSPAAWFDASDASTLFDATSGGSAVAADGAIARWEDKSTHGRHVVQSNVIRKPLRKAAIRYNRDVVRFDGVWNTLSNTSAAMIRATSGVSCFAVCYTNNSGGFLNMFAISASDTLARFSVLVDSSEQYIAGGRRGNADSFDFVTSSASKLSVWNNFGVVASYANSEIEIFEHGQSAATDAGWLTDGVTPSDSGELWVGSGPASVSLWNGDIGEILIFESELSTDNRQKIEGYLAHKWGLVASLANAHPYSQSPPVTSSGFPRIVSPDLVGGFGA